MATSLAEQLKRLAAPQTGLLLQDKKRPSLLFDPKEAANLDRETVLEIGKNGLEELIKLCKLFEPFQRSLFAQSSIGLERSVQDAQLNQKLDEQIQKFLILLSPYFLLNTAHKTLEWLIYRFHIHQFNRDEFLMLILPYHETRMFARALQLVDVSNPGDKWHWLEPLQKPGVPLSTTALINRVASDNGLLKLLCGHVITATRVYGKQAESLSTLYAFYTTAMVGAVNSSTSITEVQINHMLPSLEKGLTSTVQDFSASNYMLLAKLATKVRLNENTLKFLYRKLFKHPVLKHEAVLLLVYLYKEQAEQLSYVDMELIVQLTKHEWFPEMLAKVKSSGVNVVTFLALLLESCLRQIQKNPKATERIQTMISKIFECVQFKEDEVDIILQNTLRMYLPLEKMAKESMDFLSSLFRSLERQYPTRFDVYLKNLMKSGKTDRESQNALRLLMSWNSDVRIGLETSEILVRINHISPEQRIAALKIVANGKVEISEYYREMMNNALLARIKDDEVEVVLALLSFPVDRLKNLFTTDTLVDELLTLLSKCHSKSRKILVKPALTILLKISSKETDDARMFVTLLPYLFPRENERKGARFAVEIAMQVLESNFAKNNPYMQMVRKDIGESPNAEAISSAAFHNILNRELLPSIKTVLSTMKRLKSYGDAASTFFSALLLGSICRVPVGSLAPSDAREIIEAAWEMIKVYPKVVPLLGCNQLNRDKMADVLDMTSDGILPLQVGTYVLEMVHRRLDLNCNSRLDFDGDAERSQLVLRLLEIFFEGMSNMRWCEHYSWCLQIFFKRHFVNSEDMMCFLSQLFVKPINPQTSLHCLQICLSILNRSTSVQWAFQDRVFIPNLLLALASSSMDCRKVALNILERLCHTFNLSMEGFSTLLHELTARKDEITLDPNQLSLILYTLLSQDPDVQHQISRELRPNLKQALTLLLKSIVEQSTPINIVSQLLDILTHVNGVTVLKTLAPLGIDLLDKLKNQPKHRFVGNGLKNILQKFDASTSKALNDERVWELFEKSMMDYTTRIYTDKGFQPSSVITMKQINESFFDCAGKVAKPLQGKILQRLVDAVTDGEISSVVAAGSRAVRRIQIDAKLIVDELCLMKDAKVPNIVEATAAQRRKNKIKELLNPELVKSREWRRGITLLEFVQRADNINREELLLPVLFDLLRMCLDFQEQSALEYTKQLLLSSLCHLATKSVPIPDAHTHVDLIAQCIRTSQNPQTHHHALLVLVELFKVADVERALHNIMPIFTFMGSSVLRQDDAYSIQIISKTIETIVPIVNATRDERHACEILRVFITSLPDIPEHRRVPLFVKLLQLLENRLHLFYLLTFESHVLSQRNTPLQLMSSQKLDFALNISQGFTPQHLIQVCIKLVQFARSLPIEIDEDHQGRKMPAFAGQHIFDVCNNSAKQLRHYKYTLIPFLSSLLSAPEFVNKVASLSSEEVENMNDSYDELIVELVILIQSASKSVDLHQGKPKVKYWKVLLHHLYEVLDNVNSLLPNKPFVASVKRLVGHELLNVRRKALELLNTRLQQKNIWDEDREDLLTLIKPLVRMVSRGKGPVHQDQEIVQQTALISLKFLAKVLATDDPQPFRPILELTTELIDSRQGPILASSVLCLAELCSAMGTHAIQSLNKFMPVILRLLREKCVQENPDLIVVSLVSALQKIVDSLGNFLSLYLDQLLYELARLSTLYTDTEHIKIGVIVARLKATSQKLSNSVPLRVLLPAVSKTYDELILKRSYKCVGSLMSVLAESFANIQPADLATAIQDLASFFLKVLQFRENVKNIENAMELDEEDEEVLRDVVLIEESASKALVALVLKLSEATFRPLYYRLYDWAARHPHHKQRNITFYRLSANIAECLKSLFVLFAGHFLKHAASLLTSNNLSIVEDLQELTLPLEAHRAELIEAILLTLHRVFTYDAQNFVNQERFQTLAQPIIDQIENVMGDKERYEKRVSEVITPCIASFAGAIQDDSLHKQLVYQTLLKTRHTKPHVRSAALNTLVEIARRLGTDFMPLLPETVPFLAELLEDEDEATEKLAQNAVRTLEDVLGEPLQKYF